MAQVKSGARTARPITINHGSDKYEIIPNGDNSQFVEVPNDVVKTQFVQNLINSGDLIVKGYEEPKKGKDDEEDEKLASLRQEAQSLGIDFDGRASAATLQKKIDEAKAPK
jgi:hypothetical protein